MVVELIEQIKNLNEKELLSYWIRGEYEEAETYWRLAENIGVSCPLLPTTTFMVTTVLSFSIIRTLYSGIFTSA